MFSYCFKYSGMLKNIKDRNEIVEDCKIEFFSKIEKSKVSS